MNLLIGASLLVLAKSIYYYPESNQNGEFYIDTFTIKQFGNQIKFPNGFYHVFLIDFFVYECGMPISHIKYKLIARHGIKNDTFKDFQKYILKTFPEQTAKKWQIHLSAI